MTRDKRPVRDSRVEMTELVLPSHTNQLGTIFGGQLMAWIDIAAAISASRHARSVCVTASLDALHFLAPVRLGEHVTLLACVNYTGTTSMEVGVRLEGQNPVTGARAHVATAYLTFVSIDGQGKPKPVAEVVPETPDEERRYQNAQKRRAARLLLKDQLRARESK